MSGDEIIRWMDYAWHGVILLGIAALFYGYWYWRWSALVDHGTRPERRILRPVPRRRGTSQRKHRRR